MKSGSRRNLKARSRKLFHLRVERWGIFKIKCFKPKQSSVLVSKAKNWTENHWKTKICIPAMLKAYSASSFCLPNKNRVGVAHGDGTNLEVVYTQRKHQEISSAADGSHHWWTLAKKLAKNVHPTGNNTGITCKRDSCYQRRWQS